MAASDSPPPASQVQSIKCKSAIWFVKHLLNHKNESQQKRRRNNTKSSSNTSRSLLPHKGSDKLMTTTATTTMGEKQKRKSTWLREIYQIMRQGQHMPSAKNLESRSIYIYREREGVYVREGESLGGNINWPAGESIFG